MNKSFTLFLLLSSMVLWLGNETGAFPENTGAPGDLTCGRAPCHNIPNNIGTSIVSITVDSLGTQYFADSTHKIKVQITDPLTMKNGFEILALDEMNQNVGQWILTVPNKTQIKSGISFPQRKYVTHKASGNMQSEWQISWKAPSVSAGKVTFYAAILSSNNDDTNQNDKVYTTKKEVIFSAQSATNDFANRISFQVYPNPISESVNLFLATAQNLALKIQIVDISGHIVFNENWQIQSGQNAKMLDLKALPKGVFTIQLIENQNIVSKKIIKN